MSDMLEKIYREEQNTDEKFVAAADFFMGLKEKTALKAPPKTKKVRVAKIPEKKVSVNAANRQNTKQLVAKSGGSNIRLNATQNISQGSAPKARTFKKTDISTSKAQVPNKLKASKLPPVKDKKKVKIVIAKALAENLTKEAYLLQGLRGLGMGAKAAKDGVKNLANTATTSAKEGVEAVKAAKDPFMQGVKSDGQTVIGRALRAPFKSFSMTGPGKFLKEQTPNLRRLGRNTADLFRNADAVKLRRAGTAELKAWDKLNPKPGSYSTGGISSKATPEELATYTARREAAKKKAFAPLANFEKGLAAENALGANATTQSILKSIRGPDGKITGKSVFKGAEDLGLFDPATLATLGMGAVGSAKAAKAARQAAIADRNKKLMIGGGLGLGALALMSSGGKKAPPPNYS